MEVKHLIVVGTGYSLITTSCAMIQSSNLHHGTDLIIVKNEQVLSTNDRPTTLRTHSPQIPFVLMPYVVQDSEFVITSSLRYYPDFQQPASCCCDHLITKRIPKPKARSPGLFLFSIKIDFFIK